MTWSYFVARIRAIPSIQYLRHLYVYVRREIISIVLCIRTEICID